MHFPELPICSGILPTDSLKVIGDKETGQELVKFEWFIIWLDGQKSLCQNWDVYPF